MPLTSIGSCLCGSVKFSISGEFESFWLCHCARCQKDTGSAHAANLFSSIAKINWLSGGDDIRTYRVPKTRHQRSFCGMCGSALPSVQFEGALLVVPAGCLDSPITIRPNAHICCANRATWDAQLENVTKMDDLPG
ncbi:GFA family protein [Devosia rhodophyticola]|uniref:GFA family protein n=1 Tax=Devosia rhodophyticola TaxID=3026423 RepID=A0ABY7Z107_9HYPH|nr:GFA family protein [Devosia rhodophyticola]WDR06973.1 GFA family protein [Devosia rhodophyticola]